MREKKVTVRFTEEEYLNLQKLKEDFLKNMGLKLTDSDILRQGVTIMYDKSIKEK